MRRLIVLLLVLGVLLAAGIGAYFTYAPLEVGERVTVLIESGESSRAIARKLDEANLLRDKTAFLLLAKLKGVERHLRPGLYEFEGPTALTDVLDKLRDGRAVTVSFTIPEGWTIAKMAGHLAGELMFDSAKFVAVTRDGDLLQSNNVPLKHLEGYLLPDTYEFFWGVKPKEVVERMVADNMGLFDESTRQRMNELQMTRHEVLTLASMIEAETGIVDERAQISGVFHNRRALGMLMQCDPTVIYGMGGLKPGRQLLRKHLEIESDYNTYLNPGLPVGPICNPGRAAIQAALYPDSTDAIFFVADGSGGHVFSKTLRQHNQATARLRQLRRNQ